MILTEKDKDKFAEYDLPYDLPYKEFDRCLFLTDWRYSATALGLMRFLDAKKGRHYEATKNAEGVPCLYYTAAEVTSVDAKKDYLAFAEEYFAEFMVQTPVYNF